MLSSPSSGGQKSKSRCRQVGSFWRLRGRGCPASSLVPRRGPAKPSTWTLRMAGGEVLLPAPLLCRVASQASWPPGRPSGQRRRSRTAVRPHAQPQPSPSTPRAPACARPRLPVWETTVPSPFSQLLAAVLAALPSQDHDPRRALGAPADPAAFPKPVRCSA